MAKWILPFFLLVGCGEQQFAEQNPYPFGAHYDVESALGLRIRYSLEKTQVTWPPEVLDDMYRAAASCAQLSAPVMPMVIFQDTPPLTDDGTPASGMYYYVSGGVVLLYAARMLGHESLHHLMSHNNFPESQNRYHESRLFKDCA